MGQQGSQKIPQDKWKWKWLPNSTGCSKISSQREVYSNTGLPQETRKSQINNLMLHLKQLEKEEQAKPKVSGRKEIINTRAEINDKETKKIIAKIKETKNWRFFEKINKIDKPLAKLKKKKQKEREVRSIKLKMKKKLKLTRQKYKG